MDHRFDSMDAKFDEILARMDAMDDKLVDLIQKFEYKLLISRQELPFIAASGEEGMKERERNTSYDI